jgi:hypothetical protein
LPRVKPFPRVRQLFERIRHEGKRIALASSAKEDELAAYKQIAAIEDLIDAETSSDDAEKSKPYPDIFHAALSHWAMLHRWRLERRRHTLRCASRSTSTVAHDWIAMRRLERRRTACRRLHRHL